MSQSRFDVRGKVAVVTGGTKGLGRAFAAGLAAEGARVVITGRDRARCEQAAAELRGEGGDVTGLPCHVGQWDLVPGFVDDVYARFGRIDVLINNAAISPGLCALTDMTAELWDKVQSVNVKGPLRLAALVAPRMGAAGGGSIVNVASVGSRHPHASNGHYDTSKAALVALSSVMAAEWASLNVRVNVVLPGPFMTRLMKEAQQRNPAFVAAAGERTLLRRLGEPSECVGIVLYLASNASSFVTGASHEVSGGWH